MSAFILADVAVSDLNAYRESGYLEAVPEIAAKYNGKYRVRGGQMEQLEGEWMPTRMVIIEFPDMTSLKEFVDCEEYKPWREVRQSLATSHMVAIEGVDEVS